MRLVAPQTSRNGFETSGVPARRDGAVAPSMRRGFTLFEVILVVVVVGMIGVLAVPQFTGSSRLRLTTAANVLAADIEFCENDCITHPNALRIIQFNTSNNTYWVALASASSTPINHPEDSLPYQNDFLTGRNVRLTGISISSISFGSGVTSITPDAYGCPNLPTDATINLTDGTYTMTITVNASTGDVSIGAVH